MILTIRRIATALIVLIALNGIATLHAGELRLQSSDLSIAKGDTISIDGKTVGGAPYEFTLKTNIRYKIEAKSRTGNVQTFFVTTKELTRSELVKSIPAWFFNPTILQSEFPGYGRFTQTTANAATLSDAMEMAKTEVRTKLKGNTVDRYFTVRPWEANGKLDSSKSKYYPNLTRGQMDSLNDVNGGKMVTQSLVENARIEFLEFEIQEVDNKYQVYVLAGSKER